MAIFRISKLCFYILLYTLEYFIWSYIIYMREYVIRTLHFKMLLNKSPNVISANILSLILTV